MCSRPFRPRGLPIYVARVPAAPFARRYPRSVEFEGPPQKQPWGTYAMFKDSEGIGSFFRLTENTCRIWHSGAAETPATQTGSPKGEPRGRE